MLALRLHVKDYKGGTLTVVGTCLESHELEKTINNLLSYLSAMPSGLTLLLSAHKVDDACKSKLLNAMNQRTLIAEVVFFTNDEALTEPYMLPYLHAPSYRLGGGKTKAQFEQSIVGNWRRNDVEYRKHVGNELFMSLLQAMGENSLRGKSWD